MSKLGTVVVHYCGGFAKNPLRYEGGALVTMGEVKFHEYNYQSFSKYVIKVINTFYQVTRSKASVGLYYCLLGKELSKGLRYMVCEDDYRKFVKYANAHDEPIRMYVDLEKLDMSSFIEESDDECVEEEVKEEVNEEVKEDKPHCEGDDDSEDSDFDVDKEGESENESESDSVYVSEESDLKSDIESDSESDCPSLDHLSADEELIECRKMKQNRKKGNAQTKKSPNKGWSPSKQPMPVLRTPTKGISPRKLVLDDEKAKKHVEDEDIDTGHHSDPDYNPNVEEGPEAEENAKIKSQLHDPKIHWRLMHPFKGERFESIDQFKDSIVKYALANGYPLYYEESKKTHVLVRCGIRNAKEKGIVVENPCPFRLWASWIQGEQTFQIKSLRSKHTCSIKHHLSGIVTAGWIARQFGDKIRMSKKITLAELRHLVMKKYNVRVTHSQCSRARAKAIYELTTILNNHYARIWDYAEAVKNTNPGSTVEVAVHTQPDGSTIFHRFYVCFNACKEGWLAGCRKVIGLDGCFLKGTAQGELLSAVGRDANNQVFPIAWALVDVETTQNWLWFIRLIQNDLGLGTGDGIAIISDQHKGLIEAMTQVLPNCEHRQCARHVYANFSKKWPGVYFKNYFWQAAKSFYPEHFLYMLDKIRQGNEEAYNYLLNKQPYSWTRAFYQAGLDCDSVENGICECWNSMIRESRKLPIIHMFEEIRRKVMTRLNDQRLQGQLWTDDLCPNVRLKLELSKHLHRDWEVFNSGYQEFEVINTKESFVVNLDKKECTCRSWQLSGIPCLHGVRAIYAQYKEPEPFVSDSLRKNKFMATYMYKIRSVGGEIMWPKTNNIPPLAPPKRRMPGRPTVKRKRAINEDGPIMSTKSKKCSKCCMYGHNSRSCSKVPLPREPKIPKKRGRPRVDGGRVGGGRGSGGRGGSGRGGGRGGSGIGEGPSVVVEEQPIQQSAPVTVGVEEQTVVKEHVTNLHEDEPIQSAPVGNLNSLGRKKRAAHRQPFVAPRKKSERIINKQLGKNVITKDGVGSNGDKPLTLE